MKICHICQHSKKVKKLKSLCLCVCGNFMNNAAVMRLEECGEAARWSFL